MAGQNLQYPYFQPLSLAGGVRSAMSRNPGKIAFRHGTTERSYCELVDRFDRVTAAVVGDPDLRPGDHGAIVAKNSIAYVEIFIGASNAAPFPQALKERIIDHFGEGLLHETYGSTEAGIVSNLHPVDQRRKQQCVGQPFPCTLVKVVDDNGDECPVDEVGELFSLSPYLFNGYWDRPVETSDAFHDGWATVGDLARWDEEGYLYLVDGKKDLVISGGVNIYPREIEEILLRHVDIEAVGVVGVADEKWGERLKAFVVVRSGATLDRQEILDFCDGRIAKIKTPKEVAFIAALPRNASGKVLKTELHKLQ